MGSLHGSGPSLGVEVRDGDFAFTATSIHLGVPKTGNRTAEGVFVLVNLSVKNKGTGPRSVYCQNQTLRDFAGKRYENAVSVGASEDQLRIQPGKAADITCAFDVPTGTLPAAIEVRDSQFSRGVRVMLLGRRDG
jgi:hypothetical protein